jgi:GDP-mannose 6-dehydrogenase
MNISIFGMGYVGAVSMACLARDGHRVIGVDIDPYKLELIRSGNSPIVEEGIQELMADVVASGKVTVTHDVTAAVHDSDISFVCVGTPSASNGSQDQRAVLKIAGQFAEALKHKNGRHVFVFRSTVVPGTVEDLLVPLIEQASGKRCNVEFDVCFQPEFLREGTSIQDYDKPPFTIIGTHSDHARNMLRELFGHLPCQFQVTSIRSAEMIKYCCNNFHTVKITFANEVARLCAALKVDPFEVMALVCQDKHLNISAAYLKPGYAFGGSCLPKDLRATLYMAKQYDLNLPMLASLLPSNQAHIDHAFEKVMSMGQRKVAMIGLAFKSGTDDLRESPLVSLAERLLGKGMDLVIYDGEVSLSRLLGANKRYIDEHIPHLGELLHPSLPKVVAHGDILILGSSDRLVHAELKTLLQPHHRLIDLALMEDVTGLPCVYEGLCW